MDEEYLHGIRLQYNISLFFQIYSTLRQAGSIKQTTTCLRKYSLLSFIGHPLPIGTNVRKRQMSPFYQYVVLKCERFRRFVMSNSSLIEEEHDRYSKAAVKAAYLTLTGLGRIRLAPQPIHRA